MKTLWINETILPPEEGYTQIFGYKDLVEEIKYNGLPDKIFFEEKDGYKCAELIVEKAREEDKLTPKFALQQMDLDIAKQIILLIENYNKN